MTQQAGNSRWTFERVYLYVAILLVCGTALLPAIEIISYRLLGYDAAVLNEYTVESFEAARATAPLRRGYGWTLMWVALGVAGLALVALVRRWRRGAGVPWLASLAIFVVGLALALLMFVGLIAPSGICC